MEFTERVLILRVGRFREADLWVRFLSPTRGILSAFAFGGMRSRKRFTGCLDSFNDVLFQIKGTRGGMYLSLQEGVLMGGPRRLREDWRRAGLAMNCLKFLEAFGVGPEGAAAAHSLFSAILELLEEDGPLPDLLPVFFRARLAVEQGYALTLDRCARCGAALRHESRCFFLPAEGFFVCAHCSRGGSHRTLPVGGETLDALAQVLEYDSFDTSENSPCAAETDAPRAVRRDIPDWKSGKLAALSPVGRKEFSRTIDSFIQYHVGLYWDNGRFLRG